MKDLAPMIYRQRLVLEWYPWFVIEDYHIIEYLKRLCEVLQMIQLSEPVCHKSDKFWWAGWMHWETSWVHLYAREQPLLFFSVDIYTCKAFEVEEALVLTKEYFQCADIVFKEF